MVKMQLKLYLNTFWPSFTNIISTHSPALMSGWRLKCICREREQSCSTVPLTSAQESVRCGNSSPICCCWSSSALLSLWKQHVVRGNSCLNRIMSDFQSTLHVSTVEVLMRISINGVSPENYHSAVAVARWLESTERARRPNYKD